MHWTSSHACCSIAATRSPTPRSFATRASSSPMPTTGLEHHQVASVEMGQGTRTMHAQIVADSLGIPIGQASAAPYAINWSNVPIGEYRLRVRATDSQGATFEEVFAITITGITTTNRMTAMALARPK